jgi:5,10-methenyltetrahydromethanopterin hydrogenase
MRSKTHIIIEFDHESSQVGIQMVGVPVGLAQMMVHEAMTQLDFLRRAAVMREMQQAAADQALAASIVGRRGNGG